MPKVSELYSRGSLFGAIDRLWEAQEKNHSSIPGRGTRIFSCTESRLPLGPSRNFKIYARISFRGGTALGAEGNHSPSYHTEIKNEQFYIHSSVPSRCGQGKSALIIFLHAVFVYFKVTQISVKREAPYSSNCN
jgi:hypothetical protein